MKTTSTYKIMTAPPTTGAGATKSIELGAVVAEGKGKDWLVMTGATSIDAGYDQAMTFADAAISAKFTNGIFVLFHKDKDKYLAAPEGYQFRMASVAQRVSANMLYDTVKMFLSVERKACIKIVEQDEISFSAFKEHLHGMSTDEIHTLIAECEMAAKPRKGPKKELEPLQHACITWKAHAKEHMNILRRAGNSIVFIETVVYKYPSSFLDHVPSLKCIYFHLQSKSIRSLTLKECLDQGLYLDDTLVFSGDTDAGKTELCTSLGAWLAHEYRFSQIEVTTALDHLGMMTKNGSIQKIGAFVWSDPDLTSCKDCKLSFQEKKKFFKVNNAADFKSRQHIATLPELVPRLLSINTGLNEDGTQDHGKWFDAEGLPGPAALAREKLEDILALDQDNLATVTHIKLFKIESKVYDPNNTELSRRDMYFRNRRSNQ